MTIKQQIDQWLNNKNSAYSDGLALYNLVKISKKHDQFLSGNHDRNSMQFMLLKNNLIKASQKIAINGEPPVKMQDPVTKQPVPPAIKKIEVKPLPHDSNRVVPPLPRDSRRVGPTVSKEEVKHTANIRIADNPHIPIHLLDAEHKSLYQEIKNQFPIASKLHDNMKNEKSVEKRAAIFSELIKLDKKIRANREMIIDWVKANLKPEDIEAFTVKPEDVVQLETSIVAFKLQRIKSLNDMISREQRNLEAGKMKPKSKLKAKVRLDKWKLELSNLKTDLNVQ